MAQYRMNNTHKNRFLTEEEIAFIYFLAGKRAEAISGGIVMEMSDCNMVSDYLSNYYGLLNLLQSRFGDGMREATTNDMENIMYIINTYKGIMASKKDNV